LTLKVKVPREEPEYHVFERNVQDKSSFLEWRLAFMFDSQDIADREKLQERLKRL